MQEIRALFIGLAVLSCVPREATGPVEVSREKASSVLSAAVARSAFTRELTGFGKYRGTQGLMALEGSFTLYKDASVMRLTLHGPFGGVLSVVELPNQGTLSLLFGVPDEAIADSLISATRLGSIIIMDLRLGYDTARVSLEGDKIRSLSVWGESFFFGDYRRMECGLEFPFRVDYSGKDGNASLFFEEVRLKGEE
ncbi:MAG: hypothetical protein ABIN54_06235 [candidate division WOR-3 bacterium]